LRRRVTTFRRCVPLLAVALAACAVFSPRALPPGERWAQTYEAALSGHTQRHGLSCEARAACDLLAAHGMRVGEDEFLARLPRSENPDEGFVGDVDGPGGQLPPEGYGVHAGPVALALRASGLDARAERGRDLAWLRAEVDAGRPVLVWLTPGCRPSRRVTLRDARGKAFVAVPWEHAALVIGEKPSRIVFLDPSWGEVREADDAAFDAAWALFDRAAVSAAEPPPAARPEAGARSP